MGSLFFKLIGEDEMFSCGLGIFVPISALCDGINDCGFAGGINGIDEDLLLCDSKLIAQKSAK